ncbi:MAG: 2-hydroxyacyl-CoA dehydratase [Acidobacteria bacterium]|nr:2-hydroxyacyl-CoA dehydratase [Acidobacteriota bacterium]MBI3655213.1 2-hydroxyacyl-CoA dehydratase [Acidobacteriota bacterium]
MAPAQKSEYRGYVHQMQKTLMVNWYERLGESALKGWPPAVCLMVSGNCIELLQAFDVLPIYPEVNALQLAIRHQSLEPIVAAEEIGYASDNCAYVKADIGAYLKGITPTGNKMPTAALILCNFVGCNTYLKWFEHVSAFTGAPMYVLDVPFLRYDKPTADDITYVVKQLKELVGLLEGITHTKFDYDRFKQAVQYSAEVESLWSEIKHLSKHSPSPFDAYFDAITLMGPLYVYRASSVGVDFFRAALQELKERVANGQGVYDEERFRIVVEGPPPYPHFKTFRDMFAKWRACTVASTYSTVGGLWEFGFRHDPENPFESVALHMIENNVTNRNYLQRYAQIERYADEWKADGVIIHFVKSCRLFSAGQGDMRDYFTKVLKRPTLYIESDLEDPRYFSEAQIRNRMDAFFESLEHQKTMANVAGE